jgi:ABC transporter substrate binding protein (PQQ-dependent alcohol dehydrogenase system)
MSIRRWSHARRPWPPEAIPKFQFAALVLALLLLGVREAAAETAPAQEIRIAYLGRANPEIPAGAVEPLPPPADEGVQGARLGIADNNTTGRFLNQSFHLDERSVSSAEEIADVLHDIHALEVKFLVVDLAAEALDRVLTSPEAKAMLVFNAGAPDDRFRNEDCRAFLLHTVPSRAMLADALAQYLVKKNWTQWFLVVGERPEDRLYAAALRRAAGRFGGSIVAEKTWVAAHEEGARTDQEEVAVFTQGVRYDVLLVADEAGAFGDELPYRTWDPRPVAGTQGLTATAWHATLEQWAAAQLQSRFRTLTGRWMTSRDYAAWTAVRTVGEAATRSRSADFAALARTIRAGDFEIAAFKGRKLSFRAWDGQLRQPIPIAWARGLVGMSPQEGFLHPRTELDTLGYDESESGCRMFTESVPPSMRR